MTFAEWQASRGILPWTAVHGARTPGRLALLRAAHRATRTLPGVRRSFVVLGESSRVAAVRTAHLTEVAELHLESR
jgi:hypothetical protein